MWPLVKKKKSRPFHAIENQPNEKQTFQLLEFNFCSLSQSTNLLVGSRSGRGGRFFKHFSPTYKQQQSSSSRGWLFLITWGANLEQDTYDERTCLACAHRMIKIRASGKLFWGIYEFIPGLEIKCVLKIRLRKDMNFGKREKQTNKPQADGRHMSPSCTWLYVRIHTRVCSLLDKSGSLGRSGLSTWKYQFSYDYWSQATLSLVSAWMRDSRSSVAWVLLLTLKVG